MKSLVKNPNQLTKDEIYGLVRKWIAKELEIRELDITRASSLAKSILDHLETHLEQTTPFNALLYMSQEFPEVLDITLHEREEIEHEKDLETINYIKQCLDSGDLDKITNIINKNGQQ